MSVVTLQPGGLCTLDPSDKRVVAFDWSDSLLTGVAISTSSWTITAIRQAATALTKDSEDKLTAAEATTALERTIVGDDRVSVARLDATTASVGDVYEVANKIVTNESVAQTKERSIQVLIQNL